MQASNSRQTTIMAASVTYFEATISAAIAEVRQASIIAVIAVAAAGASEFNVFKRFFCPVRALYSVIVFMDQLAPDDLCFFLCCYRHAFVSTMV